MSPKPSLVRSRGCALRAVALARHAAAKRQVCAICSMSGAGPIPTGRARNNAPIRPNLHDRRQSLSTGAPPPPPPAGSVRAELEQTLVQLQSHSPQLFNLSRLQLALQGLRQAAGEEAVRVAILGLANGSSAGLTAKRVLRAILSDPLQDKQEWETQLDAYDLTKPLVVRVSAGPHLDESNIDVAKDNTIQRLHISSPDYNALGLEFLLMDVEASALAAQPSIEHLENAALVPSVATRSADGRVAQTPAPVHQALIVADGLMGAVGLASLPAAESGGAIAAAVDIKGFAGEELHAPFHVIDIAQAEDGVRLFREGPQNAMQYERLWFASKLPALTTWLKAGLKTDDVAAATKPAVKQLLAALLDNARSALQAEESIIVSKTLASKTPLDDATGLHSGLSEWARQAHSELQDELDLAFTGRRWRKLGWWKLFWRVDDVGMLTSDILSQRFLPTAERELVYLTGRIAELRGGPPTYPQPVSELPDSPAAGPTRTALPKWPGHIAFTRRYLQDETVPALQALAQRLLVQSLGTSTIATTVAGMLYVSSFTAGVYEAGAVAALGIVYSLGRMQKKWETARRFWEGDVREEGRKAVRAVEESVSEALIAQHSLAPGQAEELQKAKELVTRAEDLLSRLR
ncbi:hypothetical protein V2A60_000790 [Cordyceps javanica]|uniref:Serine threonine protein phosphatase 2b catalytic subunit protein n=1 Tax=Cordyceps javanica TaxID=43265 RepID=A0A545V1K3_9HYPO|nr:serine threonine protein phosphatase 2b catalytic subunit protein [Cordyceps javanica]TQW07192.1 hypothetical protein IF2G_05576 [Cordyceps javanica]